MPKRALASELPYPVVQNLQRLGQNLRIARLRRNISQQELADKIGSNRRVVADAENGKPGTAIGVYAALLWTMSLEGQLAEVADPEQGDPEGLALAQRDSRQNAGSARKPLSNDF